MTKRIYQGPPRKLNDHPRTAEEVRSGRGMPGGKSYGERLTESYGDEGVGWEFSTDSYSVQNEFEVVDTAIRHKLAREALGNRADGLGQVTDEGVPLSSRTIDDYTRTALPPSGDILVYPDGDNHLARKKEGRQ